MGRLLRAAPRWFFNPRVYRRSYIYICVHARGGLPGGPRWGIFRPDRAARQGAASVAMLGSLCPGCFHAKTTEEVLEVKAPAARPLHPLLRGLFRASGRRSTSPSLSPL